MKESKKIEKAKKLARKEEGKSLSEQIKIETTFIQNLSVSDQERSDILNLATNFRTNNQPY